MAAQKKLPDPTDKLVLKVQDEDETKRLGNDISRALKAGNILALSGELGAGKSFLARAIIQSLAEDPELEVPSPTYTICQYYETALPVFHYDLYRLSDISELDELGWQEGLETGAAIMEWPEQVFDDLPFEAVHVQISDQGKSNRQFEFTGNLDLLKRLKHSLKLRAFIEQSPLSGATRSAFAADASARRYELVHHEGETHYLMDAPRMPDGPPIKDGQSYSKIAHLAEDVSAFVAIDIALRKQNLCAPKIFSCDLDQGLLLIESLGAGKIIDENRQPIEERYMASIAFLADMHTGPFQSEIPINETQTYIVPKFDEGVILAETDLLLQWYAPEFAKTTITKKQEEDFVEIWRDLSSRLAYAEKSLVLRDYHSPNIIWREGEADIERIGVIDFQDALIGSSAYDVASLAQDARVDVSAELEQRLVDHYISLRIENTHAFDMKTFNEAYAIMAAQRATKILGIFVRLNKRDHKPEYMAHLPRMLNYLQRSLRHAGLAEYKQWLDDVIKL